MPVEADGLERGADVRYRDVVMPNACGPVIGRAAVAACYQKSGGALALRAVAFRVDGGLAYIIGE